MTDRRIEYLPITKLQPAKRNPKDHDIGELTRSIQRFGFNDAVVIDERTGRLVSGHGRAEALLALFREWDPVTGKMPDGIKLEAGVWCVPVQRGWASRDDVEAEAFIVAANRLVEAGGYHDAVLEEVLRDLATANALDGIGYDASDVEALLAAAAARDGQRNTDPDEVPPQPEPRAKLGDVFQLGAHRLMCGSSTEAADVRKLLGDAKPHLMVTDPPYGVDYDPSWRDRANRQPLGPTSTGKVLNDDRADWTDAWRLFPGDVAYVWHGALHAGVVELNLKAAGFEIRSQIIWAKPALVMGRGHYHWQHEPAWYAVRKGGTGHWAGDRKQATLWEIAGMNPMGGSRAEENEKTGHGTQKPVECMARPMRNNSQPGDAVYEPFSGSGSSIIAGEMEGRRVFAMELNPAYVDLAVARWEKFTGKTAVLL